MKNKDKRTVVISEIAVKKAETFSQQLQEKTGIHMSNGAIFAKALDEFLKANVICHATATQTQDT